VRASSVRVEFNRGLTAVRSARNVIAAVLKRLTHRNANVQLYALSLSDSLAKNCGVHLHREMASKAFTSGLEKLVADRVRRIHQEQLEY
jgi:hypothetical protein